MGLAGLKSSWGQGGLVLEAPSERLPLAFSSFRGAWGSWLAAPSSTFKAGSEAPVTPSLLYYDSLTL